MRYKTWSGNVYCYFDSHDKHLSRECVSLKWLRRFYLILKSCMVPVKCITAIISFAYFSAFLLFAQVRCGVTAVSNDVTSMSNEIDSEPFFVGIKVRPFLQIYSKSITPRMPIIRVPLLTYEYAVYSIWSKVRISTSTRDTSKYIKYAPRWRATSMPAHSAQFNTNKDVMIYVW